MARLGKVDEGAELAVDVVILGREERFRVIGPMGKMRRLLVEPSIELREVSARGFSSRCRLVGNHLLLSFVGSHGVPLRLGNTRSCYARYAAVRTSQHSIGV